MKRLPSYAATVFGLALLMVAVYTACGNQPSGDKTCLRPARYATLAANEKNSIALWADYKTSHAITLTTAQQTKLTNTGDLVGDLTLDRPVKFPDGKVDMPKGWLPALPTDSPWITTPATTDATFAAWFEVRVVDPLLYDPADASHRTWATAYLKQVSSAKDGKITSSAGADSSCP